MVPLQQYGMSMRTKRWHGVSPRASRRWLCIVAACALCIAFVGVRLVAPAPTANGPPLVVMPTVAVSVDGVYVDRQTAATADGGPSACGAHLSIAFSLPSPVFAPRHLKADALREFHAHNGDKQSAGGGNSVQVDASDLMRAEQNVVEMLPEDKLVQPADQPGGSSCGQQAGRILFNAIRNFLQEKAFDAMPIVLDYGCTVGVSMSRVHANASVICLLDGRNMGKQRTTGQYEEESASNLAHPLWRRAKNLYWLTAPHGFHDTQFAQLYDACNFVTMAVMLGAIPTSSLGGGGGRVMDRQDVVRLLLKTIPSTAVTVVAVPLPSSGGADSDVETICAGLLSEILPVIGQQAGVTLVCDVLGVVRHSAALDRTASAAAALVRLVLLTSRRPCRKTWGAPLVQWGRSQSVLFDNGAVTFRVEQINAASKGQQAHTTQGTATTTTTMRTIHPLSYIHSLNLDTLLGAGLATPLRRQVLAHMIRSPRYSDPLPHNWVLSGRGTIERIDKIDLRYDRDVDESKGYWGHATRGYLHLLAYHLCLRIAPNGLPRVAEADATCRTLCRTCARSCSYLPKGSTPCAACLQCGDCIEQLSHASLLPLDEVEEAGSRHCQKTYSSMHAARSAWKVWERADRKHPLD